MKNGKDEKQETLKRFYTEVSVAAAEDGWKILLDQRTVKTPKRADLTLPTRPLADAIAEEWRRQGETIHIPSMQFTKLANTAVDAVAHNSDVVAEDVLNFARRDLICYRAERPEKLAERQKLCWDPLLEWVEEHYGAQFIKTEGIMPIDQPEISVAALRTACTSLDPFALTALHVMTSLTGSVVATLAHTAGRLSLDECWSAAHVDEDFQIAAWGEDHEAKQRRDARFAEMRAASEFFQLSRAD